MRQLIVKLGLNASAFLSKLGITKAAAQGFGKELGKSMAIQFTTDKIFGAFKRDAGREMAAVERDVKQRSGNIKKMLGGAFAVGASYMTARGVVKNANRINDLSSTTGMDTTKAQEVDAVMGRNGQTAEGFATKLDTIGEARKDAVESNLKLRDSFREFGISLEDLRNPMLTNLDLAKKMGVALQGMNPTPEQRNALREMLGKGGEGFLSALKELDQKSALDFFANPEALKNIEKAKNMVESISRSIQNMIANAAGWGLGKVFGAVEGAGADMKERGKAMALGAARTGGSIVNTLSFGMWDRNNLQASTDRNIIHGDRITELRRKSGELPPIARATGQQFGPDAAGFNQGQQAKMFALLEDKEMMKAAHALAEEQKKTDFDRLDKLAKEKQLRQEILGLIAEATIREDEGFAVQGMELRGEAEKKQQQLDDLERQKLPGLKEAFGADSLAKVNRFVGGESQDSSFGVSTMVELQRQSVNYLKKISEKITAPNVQQAQTDTLEALNREFR